MKMSEAARQAREDIPSPGGPGLIVKCDAPGCGRAAVLDPRPLFGGRRDWPSEGPSTRFRCSCGGRQATIQHTLRTVENYGPVDRASLALWY